MSEKATNSSLFTAFCEKVAAVNHSLLKLREELCDFLADKSSELADFLKYITLIALHGYLADIFNETNKPNSVMQGANSNCIIQHERVKAFKRKLKLWKYHALSGTCDMFGHTSAFLAERKLDFHLDHQTPYYSVTSQRCQRNLSYFP